MDSKNWDSPKILLDPEDIEKEGFKEEEEEKKKTDSVPESVYPKISSDNIYSTKEDENQDSSDSESLEEELEKPNLGLSRKLTITERLSTLTEYGIEISITDPIIVSSALRKHVLYKVSGTDSVGGFQVQRRYKEFMSLRKVLLSEWPGCCILQIPPKQGNLQQDFIENRRKLLEYFMKNLSKNSYILTSEEFQLFLRGPRNFHKSPSTQKTRTINQISEKYSKVFEKYLSFVKTPEIEAEVSEISKFMLQGRVIIERLEKQTIESQQIFQTIHNGMNKILTNIKELSAHYSNNVIDIDPIPIENPYEALIWWCKTTLLEISGVLETLSKRKDLQNLKISLGAKIEEEKKNIVKRQSGKKKFIQYFNKKPNEFYIARGEAEVKRLQELISNIENLFTISTAIVIQDEYPSFKSKKIFALQGVSVLFSEKSQENIQEIIALFQKLDEKFN